MTIKKKLFCCFICCAVQLLFLPGVNAQVPAGLPSVPLNAALEEKLKVIDHYKKLGKVECYADDTILLQHIAGRTVWINEMEISKRLTGTESGIAMVTKLPAISSLALFGISFPSIHLLLQKIPKDSLHSLKLNNCSLDSVDAFLVSFRHLHNLNLSMNRLTKWPSVIDQLTELTELTLSKNEMIECHPVNSRLKKLRMAENKLTSNSIRLVYSANLQEIDFSTNAIESLPDNMGKLCPKLNYLNMNKNQLTGLPSSLSNCSKLHFLKLHKNSISQFPFVTTQLKELWELDLGYNAFEIIPREIYELKKLQHLDISGNFLTDLPDSLNKLPMLNELNTEGNPFARPPRVLLSIISENNNPQHSLEEVASFPRIRLTQNIVRADTTSYHPLDNSSFNNTASTLEIKDHFATDFRFFGYVNKISITGLKDSVWPLALSCYTMTDEIVIRNSTIDTARFYKWLSTQTHLTKLVLVNCNIVSFPQNLKWPGSLIEIDLSDNPIEALPEYFCDLPALQEVGIYGDHLKVIPDCLIGKLRMN